MKSEEKALIENAIEYISALFESESTGHDFEHTLRVYNIAMKIAESYPEADKKTVALSSLLHDADDKKIFDTENNHNARKFLISAGVTSDETERICDIINGVSFSKNKDKKPDTVEGAIVQDADRLDALGAVGIARTFAYGGKKGRVLGDSIDHFYDKLLLLKDMMNTPEAKTIAEERHEILLAFLEEYKKETARAAEE